MRTNKSTTRILWRVTLPGAHADHMPPWSQHQCNAMSQSSIASSKSFNDVCTECGSILSQKPCTHNHEVKKKNTSIAPLIGKARKPYKPRKTPQMLRAKDARADLKVDMIALVPGVSRAKAASVLSACEGSMAQLVGASTTELARVVFKGAPIGQDLGVAIWRALH